MKRILFLLVVSLTALPLAAQEGGRIFRSEVVPFDTRKDAESLLRENTKKYIDLQPQRFLQQGDTISFGQAIELPLAWIDGNIYLHLENVGEAYDLIINNHRVASIEEGVTPSDFFVSPYMNEGRNAVIIDLRPSAAQRLQTGTPNLPQPQFSNSYLFAQDKRSILDFSVELIPDSTRKFGVLNIELLVQNSFNFEEPLTVGYDIYSPDGKLQEFSVRDLTLAGRSIDTVRFNQFIYHTYNYKWENGKAPLYKVMLYTKRNGALREYMPLRIGFGKTELIDGKIMRLGKQISIIDSRYNAAADRASTLKELKEIKAQGKNTILPDYPQPYWFYDLCDQLGLYVIDRANINAPEKADDRTIGGTPSNDPAFENEYIERVKAMYYRSRNHTCIIAFALGSKTGNGYNMYKAYEWLKSVEGSRPIIYEDADGEWNSDM